MSSSNKIWKMKDFYNRVAQGYDEHMREVLKDLEFYYNKLVLPITETEEPVNIISLGCGTGIELEYILKKVPNAHIVCVDISEEMLKLLESKYPDNKQLEILCDSYETMNMPGKTFDYAICALCLHHYEYDRKIRLYRNILNSLKPGGRFIEGDFVVSPAEEREYYDEYKKMVDEDPEIGLGAYHVDVTNCVATEIKVLSDAGFTDVDVIYKNDNEAIFVAHA